MNGSKKPSGIGSWATNDPRNKISKGMSVYVEGVLKYRQYEKDGAKMTSTEIVANEIHVLGGKPKPKDAEEEVPF
jgi:single-stranded DNA-binding protein